jgi:DNA repair protein RadC
MSECSSDLRLPSGTGVFSMNPLLMEDTTMALTTTIHSALRALTARSRRVPSHPDAVSEAGLNLPRRIDDPTSAARVARDLLRSRREDVTLVLYMDDRHRFVGHAVVAVGWVQAARLSARPVLLGAQACRATGSVLVRYRRYGALSATEAEQASFRVIAAACGRDGLAVVDHLVVTTTGANSSAWHH